MSTLSRAFEARHSLYFQLSERLIALLLVVGVWLYFSLTSAFTRVTDIAQQLLVLSAMPAITAELQPYLAVDVDLWGLQRAALKLSELYPQFGIYVLDGGGNVLLNLTSDNVKREGPVSLEPIRRVMSLRSELELPVYGESIRTANKKVVFAAHPIDLQGSKGFLLLNAAEPTWETLNQSLATRIHPLTTAVALLPSLAAAVLVGVLFIRQLAKKISALSLSAQRFAQGELDVRIPKGGPDELGKAAQAFNWMADTIAENIQELQKRDVLRRSLISNIAHDLRGPIAVIKGYSESLADPEQGKSPLGPAETARGISRCADSLHHLLSQLYELTRLEAKEVIPSEIPFSLNELVEEILFLYQPIAAKRNVAAELESRGSAALVVADPVLIERALANLLENAIRHTPEAGKVVIRLAYEAREVLVEIEDSGAGVAGEDEGLIFERSYQSKSAGAAPGIAGLGLAIVRTVVRAHGSDIAVRQASPRGAVFFFRLRLHESS